ncbi:DUF2922 domain-containing protein [Staphylococcus felis]|uniref:DUF2922 domain-containing protein n=1 Tax=Staphylococcus felis TaxID=46127 RepID=A0A2K3ZG49_9STAP|nr:DUF2922 domain-containing protein [Staphylococcus felis]AVP35730.1 DUF2922 domain-containing protein [Staphylococcus felis]MBH9580847.1 DUF2922 domain-containing protein [Staphylococcus felis]MDM8327391.1 DUF2922 domain-containing protein [Staphylococcus felis]MDQ7192389.1 DUF2922 domain-containing protein [Staphylococcus felis]PNZ36833.1 DUF2922 domain-containing protein [Staphylococcus felis]
MNTKTLEITFETETQKPFKLTIPNLSTAITKELVATQAQHIINTRVLSVSGRVIKQAKSAKMIDKAITVLELTP